MMSPLVRAVSAFAIAFVVAVPAPLRAQARVAGQVVLLERPGEQTEDLAGAVAWLVPANAQRVRTSPTPATISLQARQFAPRVRVVTEGSRVDFPNQDRFSHNVFTRTTLGPFDTQTYRRGQSKDNEFVRPGVYPLYCNIHPRMTGHVVVVPTPYFAQADDAGRFTIQGVPPGSYTLHLWHARGGEQQHPVVVPAAGVDGLRYELDARGFRFVQHRNKYGQEYTNASGDRY